MKQNDNASHATPIKWLCTLLCAAALTALALLSGCVGGGNGETETTPDTMHQPGTDSEHLTDASLPTEPVTNPSTQPEDPAGTETGTETATETETETETEPETVYDIAKPDFHPELSVGYSNVKDYGAVGDGKTDDTAAVQKCLSEAFAKSGTAYFPAGTYRITQTLTLPKDDSKVFTVIGASGAVLLGDSGLKGAILQVNMKYNFSLFCLDFVHRGEGSCLDALFVQAKWCRFTGSESAGGADVVSFHGSNCRFVECSFDVNDPNVYALSYIRWQNEISINDHIVDNVFRGVGKGILVGNGTTTDGRCEGLKINGNYFYNTGSEQVRVAEILHLNIAHNTMYNCTGSAIVLTQQGSGADGVYINDNNIRMGEGALACITTEEGSGVYISSVNINSNTMIGGQYGLYETLEISRLHMRENHVSGQSVAGIAVEVRVCRTPHYFLDNVVREAEGVLCFSVPGRGTVAFARNVVNQSSDIGRAFQKEFEESCVIEKGESQTRLPTEKQN